MYGDFQCPYCAAAYPIVYRVRDQLGPRLLFAFRHFPLRDIHPWTPSAPPRRQRRRGPGAFWPMHDRLYE